MSYLDLEIFSQPLSLAEGVEMTGGFSRRPLRE
jgi:hypothetical protein